MVPPIQVEINYTVQAILAIVNVVVSFGELENRVQRTPVSYPAQRNRNPVTSPVINQNVGQSPFPGNEIRKQK